MPREVDLYCTTVILHVLQQLESVIAKAEQMLQYLEAAGRQHKINIHERREYLKNVLYQIQAFSLSVVKQCSTILLKHLQVIFRRKNGKINTPVKVWQLKHGGTPPTFLVKSISPLSVVKKQGMQQCGGCAEIAAILCDGSYLTVQTNTMIVCPVANEAKKRPLKKNEGQDKVRNVLPM